MKKSVLLVFALLLPFLILAASAQDKPDAKVLQAKLDQKVAQMKASGASQQEIDTFIAEFKKKAEAMHKAQIQGDPDEKAFMEKVNKKAKDMKAAGASDEDIKKMVKEAKSKWEAKKSEAQKTKQFAKSEKGSK